MNECLILGRGWTNVASMPLYRNRAEALATYNEIEPADVAPKEVAYADEKKAYDALEARLVHTQGRLWDLPIPTASLRGRPEQEPGAGEDAVFAGCASLDDDRES